MTRTVPPGINNKNNCNHMKVNTGILLTREGLVSNTANQGLGDSRCNRHTGISWGAERTKVVGYFLISSCREG